MRWRTLVGCRVWPTCRLPLSDDDETSLLRDVLADVPSQDFVDKGLIPDAAPTCFLTELIEHARIKSNRDQTARFIAKGRATDAPHRVQLLRR
jgi:hypothetical protein